MNAVTSAGEILEIMLRHLGFAAEVEVVEDGGTAWLNVRTPDPASLIGRRGERLDDLQHLVNKLLRQKLPDAARIRIDVENFRHQRDDRFLEEIRTIGETVRTTGQPVKLEPMNSYQRRLVHNLFKDDPDVRSWSPEDRTRLKRISLVPRNPVNNPG